MPITETKIPITGTFTLMHINFFQYTVQEKSSSFFVDDSDTAKKLLSCSNKINLNNFFKLHVFVRPGYPQCKIDDVLRDRLTKAMMKRCIQETNALDLSRFHQDSGM